MFRELCLGKIPSMDLWGGNVWTVYDFWYIYQLASQNAWQINWMENSLIYITVEKYVEIHRKCFLYFYSIKYRKMEWGKK